MNIDLLIQSIGSKKKYHHVVKKNLFTSHKNQVEQNKTKALQETQLLLLLFKTKLNRIKQNKSTNNHQP